VIADASAIAPARSEIVRALAAVAGAGSIVDAAASRFYFTDVFRAGIEPVAVVRPETVEHLQAVLRVAAAQGLAIFPRGGGASYTDGYLPSRPHSILIDTGRLDRIVEINEADAYVTVEAGVTWAALKDALDARGLRTPFFGPFSGLAATVGGSVSQNSVSHGSGTHGISAQSVLALEIVTASGEILRTGSAMRGAAPFARYYGPDLTGLFTGDCGALGIKTRITLPLLARKPAFGCVSFAFAAFADLADMMRSAALERLDDEHFAIDAALSQGQIARQDTAAMLGMARAVLATSPNLFAGAMQLLRMAAAGTRALERAQYMLHFIVEGEDRAAVAAKLARLRRLARNGTEIANSVPSVVRGMPFAPLFNTLGPKGERWVPLHGLLPHSKVLSFHSALEALYARHADDMKRFGVWQGGMFQAVGASALLYEIALYWPGARSVYHDTVIPHDYLQGLPVYVENVQVTEFVTRLKAEMTALFSAFDAVHFQLGKTYPFARDLEPSALALLRALKAQLDPDGVMNPGALGL
jgi:FAD/FMN-containing dehydrogenase